MGGVESVISNYACYQFPNFLLMEFLRKRKRQLFKTKNQLQSIITQKAYAFDC